MASKIQTSNLDIVRSASARSMALAHNVSALREELLGSGSPEECRSNTPTVGILPLLSAQAQSTHDALRYAEQDLADIRAAFGISNTEVEAI